MDGYTVKKIAANVYDVRNAAQCDFYIVEGCDKAAVIDTGVPVGVMDRTAVEEAAKVRILPLIRELTQKPLILIITHFHVDHMYHMEEFDEVYMCHKEYALPEHIRTYMHPGKAPYNRPVKDLRTGEVLDLGGIHLEICELSGHSPGSILVLDREDDILFTGDAIGNGTGAFMQVMTAESLATYHDSLVTALRWLVERGGKMQFWGGHVEHQANSLVLPGWNPLGIGLLADMIELIDSVIRKKIQGTPYRNYQKNAAMPEDVLYAAYGRAELLYKKENLYGSLY